MRKSITIVFAGIAVCSFIVLNIIFAFHKTENPRLPAISCILNLQEIGAALSQFVSSHDGDAFPYSLDALATDNLISKDRLKCPASGSDYGYLTGITLDAPSFLFLIWCPDEHDLSKEKSKPTLAKMALLADLGDVLPYDPHYFRELLAASQKFPTIASISGEDGVIRLLEIIDTERDLRTKALAIWKLGTLAKPKLSETFAQYLAQFSPEIQFESARALARISDRRGAEVLVTALRSNSYLKRRQSFLSLEILTKGETFGYNPLLPPQAQEEPLKKWQTWMTSSRK